MPIQDLVISIGQGRGLRFSHKHHMFEVNKGDQCRRISQSEHALYIGYKHKPNLVPRAHVPFGRHQDMELWNNQFPETRIFGLLVSRRMHGLVYLVSRDKVDVDTFHKSIQ